MSTTVERIRNVREVCTRLLPAVADLAKRGRADVTEIAAVLRNAHLEVSEFLAMRADCRPVVPDGARHVEHMFMGLERLWCAYDGVEVGVNPALASANRRKSVVISASNNLGSGGGEVTSHLVRQLTCQRLRGEFDRAVVACFQALAGLIKIFHDPASQKMSAEAVGADYQPPSHRKHRHAHQHHKHAVGGGDFLKQDKKARAMWDINFNNALFVPRSQAFAMFVSAQDSADNVRAAAAAASVPPRSEYDTDSLIRLDYFIDPASTGWISAYRVGCMIGMLGPLESLADRTAELCEVPGFAGWLSREDAHRMLQGQALGAYVVYMHTAGDWKSSKAKVTGMAISFVDKKGKGTIISDHLVADMDAACAFLRKGKKATNFVRGGLFELPVFHGDMSALEAARALELRASEIQEFFPEFSAQGMFLLRYSSHETKCMTMTALIDGAVVHDTAMILPDGTLEKGGASFADVFALLEAEPALRFPHLNRLSSFSPLALGKVKAAWPLAFSISTRVFLVGYTHPIGGYGSIERVLGATAEQDPWITTHHRIVSSDFRATILPSDYLLESKDFPAETSDNRSPSAGIKWQYDFGDILGVPSTRDPNARRGTVAVDYSRVSGGGALAQSDMALPGVYDDADSGVLYGRTPVASGTALKQNDKSLPGMQDDADTGAFYGRTPAFQGNTDNPNQTQVSTLNHVAAMPVSLPTSGPSTPDDSRMAAMESDQLYARTPPDLAALRQSADGSIESPPIAEIFYARTPVNAHNPASVDEQTGLYGKTPGRVRIEEEKHRASQTADMALPVVKGNSAGTGVQSTYGKMPFQGQINAGQRTGGPIATSEMNSLARSPAPAPRITAKSQYAPLKLVSPGSQNSSPSEAVVSQYDDFSSVRRAQSPSNNQPQGTMPGPPQVGPPTLPSGPPPRSGTKASLAVHDDERFAPAPVQNMYSTVGDLTRGAAGSQPNSPDERNHAMSQMSHGKTDDTQSRGSTTVEFAQESQTISLNIAYLSSDGNVKHIDIDLPLTATVKQAQETVLRLIFPFAPEDEQQRTTRTQYRFVIGTSALQPTSRIADHVAEIVARHNHVEFVFRGVRPTKTHRRSLKASTTRIERSATLR